MREIRNFNVIFHGFNTPSYFPGVTTVYTAYNDVVIGGGDNPAEAVKDCLDFLAQKDIDVEGIEKCILEQRRLDGLPHFPSVVIEFMGEIENNPEFDAYYYVSISYNLK